MKNKIIFILSATIILLAFWSGIPVKAAAKVKLSDRNIEIEVGTTYKLSVLNTDDEVTWETSNKAIAKVSSKGRITAKKAGTCKIYAYVGTKKLTCRVTVYNNYSAESDKYGVSGFSTLMGQLPLKKFKYNAETAYIKELSALGSKCTVFYGLDAKNVDIVLSSDNYVYFIKSILKNAGKHPDNAYLTTLAQIADAAYETDEIPDRDGNDCFVIAQRESDLAAVDKAADNKDSDDEGFYFIFYPNKNDTDFDCIVIGCDESSFNHITWYKLQ